MRFDLKAPCKNCPFRTDETAIRFANRERAEEIEESAYRNGFPCHLSADYREDDEGYGEDGYVFDPGGKTQHCVGALILFMNDGYYSTPGTGNDEELFERLAARVDPKAPVFDCVEDFLAANDKGGR